MLPFCSRDVGLPLCSSCRLLEPETTVHVSKVGRMAPMRPPSLAPKSGCPQGLCLLEAPGRSCVLPFLASGGARIPLLRLTASPAAFALSSFLLLSPRLLASRSPPPSCEDTGLPQKPSVIPHIKTHNFVTSTKTGDDVLFGGVMQPAHPLSGGVPPWLIPWGQGASWMPSSFVRTPVLWGASRLALPAVLRLARARSLEARESELVVPIWFLTQQVRAGAVGGPQQRRGERTPGGPLWV